MSPTKSGEYPNPLNTAFVVVVGVLAEAVFFAGVPLL
jgi:hypothetical protein